MIRQSFETALKKGAIGEAIVREHLEKKGWVIYQPVTEGAHCFDILCIKNKKTAIAIDVKAKSRLNKYPATGINQKHFEEYKAFSEKHLMPFWVIFVDEGQKTIYGNCLIELEKERIINKITYPFIMPTKGQNVRLWPLEAMKHIAIISDSDYEKLITHNQRNYNFT